MSTTYSGWTADPRATFSSFGSSLVLCYQMMTGSGWNNLVYNAFVNGDLLDVFWFVLFSFTVTMFLMNFVVAHVLTTFSRLSEYVGDGAETKSQFEVERPLPSDAPPDAPIDTVAVRVVSRPTLTKIWQASLDPDVVRQRIRKAAKKFDVDVASSVAAALHVSFSDFLAHRQRELHRHNVLVRLRQTTRAGAGLSPASHPPAARPATPDADGDDLLPAGRSRPLHHRIRESPALEEREGSVPLPSRVYEISERDDFDEE
jgi:hypothetical protein